MVLRVKVDGNEQQQRLFTKYSHLPNATGLQKPGSRNPRGVTQSARRHYSISTSDLFL